jgi:hypothetical protein
MHRIRSKKGKEPLEELWTMEMDVSTAFIKFVIFHFPFLFFFSIEFLRVLTDISLQKKNSSTRRIRRRKCARKLQELSIRRQRAWQCTALLVAMDASMPAKSVMKHQRVVLDANSLLSARNPKILILIVVIVIDLILFLEI